MNQGNRMMPLSINFYKETRKKLLNLIEEKDLEGFLVTNPANIFYFTGFFMLQMKDLQVFIYQKITKANCLFHYLKKKILKI